MSIASGWEDVGLSSDKDVVGFLEARGLGKFAQKIIEVTDAESVGDLQLLDGPMVEDVIKQADLKLVPAQKFRHAMQDLRGEAQGVSSPTAVSPDAAATDAALAGFAPPPRAEVSPPAAPVATLQECIAVCIDHSGSMGTPFAELNIDVVQGTTRNPVAQRTRMEAVKAMFYAFRDRVENLGSGTHQLGLVQFDDRVEQLLDLTPRLDRFEAIVDDMEKRGQTAIYSAIIKAAEMLQPHFKEDSPVDFRILALTDGQNNIGASASEALEAAYRIGAVVDAIIVGDRPDANLRRIVNATGGECYVIGNLGEGFELLEAEGVVSLRARRGGAEKPPFQRREVPQEFQAISEKGMTRGTAVGRAPALNPALAAKTVMDVTKVVDAVPTPSAGGANSGAVKRALVELKKLSDEGPGEGLHVFPAGDNVLFWRALLEGPPGTPFESGVFSLTVELPMNYPFSPPKILFETPIYHCNVNDSGRICLDVLADQWNPALTVAKALQAVRQLVREPDTDNALRQWIAELTLALRQHGDQRYPDLVKEHVQKDASKTVAEWRTQWGC